MSDPLRPGSPELSAPSATMARHWTTIALAGLIGARYCLPAESADQGETLWLVILTMLFGAMQAWLRWKTVGGSRSLDRIDAAVTLLAGAHIASALCVVAGEGHKRAALNLAWEWGATLLVWYEVRSRIAQGHGGPLFRSVLAIAIALGGYGIWQNQVWFKANAALTTEMEQLEAQADRTSEENTRLRQIHLAVGPDVMSAQGGSRIALLNRIRNSTEPIGCFALANTLSGVLLVGLWLMTGTGVTFRHDATRGDVNWQPGLVQIWLPRMGLIACYAAMGVCLVMSKSRSAWLGALVAVGLVWFVAKTGRRMRTGAIAALTVAIAGMALLMVALLGGLIDGEVITEAPKSLKYRLEYWVSTARVIMDQPWLGVGPGNFRASYLHHKLPGASEEILDPHNLLLDVWANAGILAWSALVALIIWGIRGGWRVAITEADPQTKESPLPLIRWSEAVWAAGIGPALVLIQQMAFGSDLEWRLGGIAMASAFLGGWLANLSQRPRMVALWGAWLALTIHLCAAGGMAMPVISQLWLLLLAGVVTKPLGGDVGVVRVGSIPLSHLAQPALAGGLLVLAFVCLRTSLLPNAICLAQLSHAEEALFTSGDRSRAERSLIAAAEADPLQPAPWLLLLQIRTVEAVEGRSDREVEAAAEAGREAIRRQPENPLPYELMGDLYSQCGEGADARVKQATGWYRQAVDRYPNAARLRAKLARSLDQTSLHTAARAEALRAIELDNLNRQAGHTDKVLDTKDRTELERIVEPH